MRKCERDYYEKEFNANKCNMRRQWQLIKSVINNKTHNKISDVMSIKGTLVNDPKLISNSLNQFYLNIGKNKGPVSNIPYNARSFMNQPCSQSFFIRETTEIEVKDIIQNLKNNSCGWDEVSSNVLKRCSECILKPLVYLLNLSLSQGIVPTECKIARVTPLYKGGDKTNMSNYRPISVLPVFSKILERIMHVRLVNYFEKYKILYDLQFGFRKGHSTQLALSYLINKLVSSYENNNYVLGLFLDFSKAFDMVNHDILLQKLEYYGVRGIGLKWMKNYLSNRYQYVYYNGVKSEMGSISCGVPQGSILGPLLFLVYINDIANVTNDCQLILYADDTNMFVTGKDIDVMIAHMNDVMKTLVQWLNVNRLVLNVSKTHYVVFSPGNKVIIPNTDLRINNEVIQQRYTTSFLGVILDDKLSWKHHIQSVKIKISKNIGILHKCRKKFSLSTMKSLYYSFIYSYLSYCVELWGSAPKKYTDSFINCKKDVVS